MDLIERQALLTQLVTEAGAAARGNGRLVTLAGPAGVGKTALARAAVDSISGAPRVLWGSCDALSTPRALGPVQDMAVSLQSWRELLDGPPDPLYRQILHDLERRFTVMVIEDVHWVDEATLDLVRWLGRRIEGTRALIIVTFRDDEVGTFHPLQVALGDIATTPQLRRLRVEPLSREGVRALAAGHEVDPEEVHQITGGNPFYVTEVLASPGAGVPQNVTDAVLARVARLDAKTADLLQTASVEPGLIPVRRLERLGHPAAALEEAVTSGMMVAEGTDLRFRHELARLAVEGTLDAWRLRQVHEHLFRELEAEGGRDVARLANHAKGAGLEAETRFWAEKAGRAASLAGAHRESASHYADALAHAGSGSDDERADLLAGYAAELEALDRVGEAIDARRQILALRAGSPAATTAAADLAAALWRDGQGDEAHRLIADAVDRLPATVESQGEAYLLAVAATLATLARRADDALAMGERAVAAAEDTGNELALVRALNLRGSARLLFLSDSGGVDDLERAAGLAEARGWHDRRGAVYTNLGSVLGEIRRYAEAARHLQAGIDFSAARDLEANRNYCVAWLARVRFEQGEWTEALGLAEEALRGPPDQSPIIPIVALTVVGRVRTRRGDGDPSGPLDRAWELATRTGELQRLWPVVAGRAELAWLNGDASANQDLAEVLSLAEALEYGWAVGELGFWAWKLGLRPDVPEGGFRPFVLHAAGDIGAAEAWSEIGCPYEAAFARVDCGGEAEQRRALSDLLDLGARPLGARIRAALRNQGVTGLPGFPTNSSHPSGLSPRELDVLEWLARGFSDRAIAERLFISSRTVNHHVASILRKLEVGSRTEAATLAHREAWIDK